MIPLIDIIFLLLVVFIFAMLSMTVHKGLRVELPVAGFSDSKSDSDHLSLTVASDGAVYIDLEPVELQDLTEIVRLAVDTRGELGVQVNAHKDIRHGRLVQVLDRVRAAGVTSLSIMTVDPESRF